MPLATEMDHYEDASEGLSRVPTTKEHSPSLQQHQQADVNPVSATPASANANGVLTKYGH